MNRSIVTTEVAVCFTTLGVLIGTSYGISGEAAGGVTARVCLKAVGVIPPPQTLPNVMEGKTFAFRKLLHVSVLVQKKLRIQPGPRREKDRFPQGNRCHRRLAEEKSAHAQW